MWTTRLAVKYLNDYFSERIFAMANAKLRSADKAKKDEFYTRLEDIESEIRSHPDYVRQVKDKVVLCNCDDPEWSNFFKFFSFFNFLNNFFLRSRCFF